MSITDSTLGATIGSVVPGVGTAIGGVVGTIVDTIGSLLPKGQHPTQSDINIGSALQPLIDQFTDQAIISFPDDKVGLLSWQANLKNSLGSSNALHAYMKDQHDMMINKYKNLNLPSSWFTQWNSLADASGVPANEIPIPTSSTSNKIVNSITSTLSSLLNYNSNLQPGSTSAGMSPIAIILIIGAIIGLGFMFFKGKK